MTLLVRQVTVGNERIALQPDGGIRFDSNEIPGVTRGQFGAWPLLSMQGTLPRKEVFE